MGNYGVTAEILIDRMMDYYNISSNNELANELNMQPCSISSWKNKNSVNAIKKKCRELGIHHKIFDEFEKKETIVNNNGCLGIDEDVLKLVHVLDSTAKILGNKNELKSGLRDLIVRLTGEE